MLASHWKYFLVFSTQVNGQATLYIQSHIRNHTAPHLFTAPTLLIQTMY